MLLQAVITASIALWMLCGSRLPKPSGGVALALLSAHPEAFASAHTHRPTRLCHFNPLATLRRDNAIPTCMCGPCMCGTPQPVVQASAAAPQPHATVEEAQAAMHAAQAAGAAAQREVAVQAAKYQVAQARLEVLQAETRWRAAQAVLDSTMAGEDGDGEDHVDGKDDAESI